MKIKKGSHKFLRNLNLRKSNKLLHNLNSQAWSIGIMLAVVIFISAILIFFAIVNSKQGTKIDELKNEAIKIIKSIASEDPDVGIIADNTVNQEKLEELLSMDYSEIKEKLRVKNEFCIYFEDESGNVIYINVSAGATHTGIGSQEINISDVPCD